MCLHCQARRGRHAVREDLVAGVGVGGQAGCLVGFNAVLPCAPISRRLRWATRMFASGSRKYSEGSVLHMWACEGQGEVEIGRAWALPNSVKSGRLATKNGALSMAPPTCNWLNRDKSVRSKTAACGKRKSV